MTNDARDEEITLTDDEMSTNVPPSPTLEKGEASVPPKKSKTGVIVGAVAAGAAFTAGTIFGIQGLLGVNRGDSRPSEDPNNPRSTAGGPVTPGPATTETAAPQKTPEITQAPSALISEQIDFTETKEWKEQMSEKERSDYLNDTSKEFDDYMDLPAERRAQISELTFRMNKPYFEEVLKRHNPDYDSIPAASVDNTNAEIIQFFDNMTAIGRIMQFRDGDAGKYGPEDDNDITYRSRVIVSVNFTGGLYQSTSLNYLNERRILTTPEIGMARICADGCDDGLEAISEKRLGSDEKHRAVSFTENASDNHYTADFFLQTFVPIGSKSGEKVGWWQVSGELN